MDYFHQIEDGKAVIRGKNGLYRQVDLFQRGGRVFAKYGAGFLRLHPQGGTSNPAVAWLDLDPGHGEIAPKALELRWTPAPAVPQIAAE